MDEYKLVDGGNSTNIRPNPNGPIMVPAASGAGTQGDGGNSAWHFLHPYPSPTSLEQKDTRVVYNAFATEPLESLRMGFEQGPYVAVEGYLHCIRGANSDGTDSKSH